MLTTSPLVTNGIKNGKTLSLTHGGLQAKFDEHLKQAAQLVEDTGYHRRDKEVAQLMGIDESG